MLYLQCDWLVYNQYVNRAHELTIFINPILTLYLNYTAAYRTAERESCYYTTGNYRIGGISCGDTEGTAMDSRYWVRKLLTRSLRQSTRIQRNRWWRSKFRIRNHAECETLGTKPTFVKGKISTNSFLRKISPSKKIMSLLKVFYIQEDIVILAWIVPPWKNYFLSRFF